jgi:hypothetical protein
MSMIKNCSLFPYANWWRLDGKSELKNTCGGIATIIIFVLIGAIFALKLVDVFKKSKITVNQTLLVNSFTPLSNLTTFQNETASSPFMLAIDFQPKAFPN